MEPELVVQTGIYGYGMFGRLPEEDLDGALGAARAAGYDGVEVMRNLIAQPAELRAACAAHGLSLSGLHVFWDDLDDQPTRDAVVALGSPRLIVSGLPVARPEDITGVAARVREVAAPLRDHEVALYLHNHAEEGRPMDDGRTPFEALVQELSAAEVGFVIDLHWAAVSGTLLRTIRSLAGRCDYYHLKDGSVTDPTSGRPYDLGAGEVDLVGAWQAICEAGPVSVVAVERTVPAPDLTAGLANDLAFAWRLRSDRQPTITT